MVENRKTLFNNETGEVNSKSDFKGILVKNRSIELISKIVEKIYEFLPSEQQYIIDEVGNVWKLDPPVVVRSALIRMDF